MSKVKKKLNHKNKKEIKFMGPYEGIVELRYRDGYKIGPNTLAIPNIDYWEEVDEELGFPSWDNKKAFKLEKISDKKELTGPNNNFMKEVIIRYIYKYLRYLNKEIKKNEDPLLKNSWLLKRYKQDKSILERRLKVAKEGKFKDLLYNYSLKPKCTMYDL